MSLVAAFRSGDTAAFAELYRRHAPAVRRVARANTTDQDTAEDIVQETFVRLFEALPTFQGDRVGQWAVRVAKRLCIDEQRRHRQRDVPLDAAETISSGTADFERAVLTRHAVDGVLGQLRRPDATLLRDHHLDDLSLRAMAARSGSSEKSLSVRLSRARRAFAAAGAHLRTLGVMPPLLWRSRAFGRGEDVHGSALVVTMTLQVAVVAALSLPVASAAAADAPPDRSTGAVAAQADHDVRPPARAGRVRADGEDRARRETGTAPRERGAAARPASRARDEVFAPVAVPGTPLRIHQRGLANKERYRYRVDADPVPVSTTVAREDRQHAAHDAACPVVASAPTMVTCEQPE